MTINVTVHGTQNKNAVKSDYDANFCELTTSDDHKTSRQSTDEKREREIP